MKALYLAIAGLLLAGITVLYFAQHRSPPAAPVTEAPVAAASDPQPTAPSVATDAPKPHPTAAAEKATGAELPAPTALPAAAPAKAPVSLALQQALQTVTTPQASFEDKQSAWSQLKDSGRLDQAIAELEQRASANPNTAEYPAALGQAYLQKAGILKDVREQGILGMKADQSFDVALNLDPANWDAAFWKATALSYWPPQLNKGQEVIDRFLELARQQETHPVRPEYAQTYVFLGEQYQKQGFPDYAKQVWQRGASFFPNNPQLAAKLGEGQPNQQPAR